MLARPGAPGVRCASCVTPGGGGGSAGLSSPPEFLPQAACNGASLCNTDWEETQERHYGTQGDTRQETGDTLAEM